MLTVQTRLGPIAYETCGDGPTLVLLHASPGSRRDYEAVLPRLAARYRVVALDWPGYGDSPAPTPPERASAPAFADALEDAVDVLGLGGAAFIGNSVGGFAAARFAITRPTAVRALVLVNTGGFTRHNALTRAFCRLRGLRRVARALAVPWARLLLRRRTPTVRAMLVAAAAHARDDAAVAVNAALWRSFATPDHDLRAGAAAIVAPTLLVWGRRDPAVPLRSDGRAAHAAIAGSTLIPLDVGHSAQAEDPDAFLAAVEPFLARALTA
jgi:pimeloyl-ACP methyl ester carboxylesterase